MRGGDRRFAFQFCRDFKIVDVDAFLENIPQAKLTEWKAFYELDPDLSYRLDWGIAHIVQAIMRNGKELQSFMLPIGDFEPIHIEAPTQSMELQERLIDAWIFGSNAVIQEQENRGR